MRRGTVLFGCLFPLTSSCHSGQTPVLGAALWWPAVRGIRVVIHKLILPSEVGTAPTRGVAVWLSGADALHSGGEVGQAFWGMPYPRVGGRARSKLVQPQHAAACRSMPQHAGAPVFWSCTWGF